MTEGRSLCTLDEGQTSWRPSQAGRTWRLPGGDDETPKTLSTTLLEIDAASSTAIESGTHFFVDILGLPGEIDR